MELVAERERLAPEVVRAEVARGRMIVPANVHHADWRADCSASLVPERAATCNGWSRHPDHDRFLN
jgi:thiamine biosynthesis protein ThiC